MENNGSHDSHDPNRPPTEPPQPPRLQRFLAGLVELALGVPEEAGNATPQPGPQTANNVVPFFSASSVLEGLQNHDQITEDVKCPEATSTEVSDPQMQQARNVVFCVEDTVGLQNDEFSIGIVDRSFGDIDSHDPRPQRDYGEDIERHPDIPTDDFAKFMKSGIPPRGSVLVSWQTQVKTELIPEANLRLLDRALYVGDVVKRNADEHMSGTVIGIKAVCTLYPASKFQGGQIVQTITDDLSIRNVPAEEVMLVHEFNEGALVVYDEWVGRIENVYDEVAVKLSNNSVVVVEDPGELEPDEFATERTSVGDFVKTKKGNLRRGRWKYGAFDPNIKPTGTVVETRTVEIDVQWIARSISARDASFTAEEPPVVLGRDDFESPSFHRYDACAGAATTLPHSSNGTDRVYQVSDVTVGDRVQFHDVLGAAVKYDGTHQLPNGYPQGKLTRVPRTESLGYDMNVFLVTQTHTQVVVQWQDLTVTEDLSSNLIPDPNVGDDDEVWPGELVFSREGQVLSGPEVIPNWAKKPAKVGVAQAVKSRDRLATVRWFKNPSVEFFGPDLLPPCTTGELSDTTEDVSFYDIYSYPALTRRRGDFVLVHPTSDALAQLQPSSNADGPNWFGEVVDLGLDGMLTVRLGAAEPIRDIKVHYEHVTLAYSSDMADDYVDEDGDSDSDSDFSDESLYNDTWIEYEGMDGEQEVGDDEDWSTEDEDDDDDDTSMPDLESLPDLNTSETTPEHKSILAAEPQNDTLDVSYSVDETMQDSQSEEPASFLILDTPAPSTHHYVSRSTSGGPVFMRRIAKEHKILRTSLPPGIFVRTWESRLDLVRILMIGPQDTPYEFAPFMVDLHLGSSYPQEPPEAFFHSWTNGNGPVNPNLYEDGKICLSLLGTWHTDERNEGWSPTKSTLLQVLVSIMGLVLVKEPYYNEAGFDVHRTAPETKLNSALYTERAYFRSRAFIHHALTNDTVPFQQELQYLYKSQSPNAPQLLKQAIAAAKDVVEQSANVAEDGERDGLRTVSLGATVMLKRQIETLEALETTPQSC